MKRRCTLIMFVLPVLLLVAAGGLWLHIQRKQYALNRQLIVALVHNNNGWALALIREGADPNTRYDPPPAPTFKRLLAHLLHHVTPSVNNSPTAFMLACGTLEGPLGGKPRLLVTKPENLALLQAMLTYNANVDARALNHRTALYDAVRRDRRHTVELLLQHGANVNAQDGIGRTPLMEAVMQDNSEMTRLLLDHGANLHVQDRGRNTALHCIQQDRPAVDTLRLLLGRGADPNRKNKYGNIPLTIAQQNHRTDLVRLLKHGGK